MATITAQGLGTYTGRRWYYRFKILPAKVTGLTLESRCKSRRTYIWNATPGANAYLVKVINRTTGKGFDKAVSTTRVDLTELTDTQLYEVQVAAYRGNTAYRGPYSKVNAKHALPGTVTGLKTQKTATGSITLEWNKKPGADGYVVYQYIAAKKQTKRLATTTARSFVFKGSGAKPGVFAQQQARRAGRVIDAIWNQYPRFTELEVRSHLARFGYRGEEVFKDCASLSGGELARLRFAELALERPSQMVLDEPTNHLAISMRERLTQALAAYTGTLLLVTHDRYLMHTLGCPIMYLEDGKATFYPSFAALQNRDAGKTQEQQKTEDTAKKQAYGKEQRKRRAEVRARLKKVESEIEELGAHIVELENEINDPEVLRDHLLLRDKCDELDDTRFHQQELYDEWEKLAEEQETFENEGE